MRISSSSSLNYLNYTQKKSSEKLSEIQEVEKQERTKSTKKVLGYLVDKDGYFTEDFNTKVGIPKDFKIHSDTMQSYVDVRTTNPIRRDFYSIDLAKTVNNAYKLLSQLVGEKELNSKDSFSPSDIVKLPQGYEYNRMTLEISKVYNMPAELMSGIFSQSRDNTINVDSTFYNESVHKNLRRESSMLNPSTNIFDNNIGGKEDINSTIYFNTTKEKYTDKEGNISKGGLLVGIMNQNFDVAEGELTSNGYTFGYSKEISGDDFNNLVKMFLLTHNDLDNISNSEFNSLSKPLKEFVKDARTHKIVGQINIPKTKEQKEEEEEFQKKLLMMLLDLLNPEIQRKLQEKASRAKDYKLTELIFTKREVEEEKLKKSREEAKNSMQEMLEFIEEQSKKHNIDNIDIKEVEDIFLKMFDTSILNPYNEENENNKIDIRI